MTKTLSKFIRKHDGSKYSCDFVKFAQNLTFEQFWNTCPKGDWILWLFKKTSPDNNIRLITLVSGHCAATVLHLMKDERSIRAVQAAIDFGEGKIDEEKLEEARRNNFQAMDDLNIISDILPYSDNIFVNKIRDIIDDWGKATSAADSYDVSNIANQEEAADICRKYLPIEVWNTSLI